MSMSLGMDTGEERIFGIDSSVAEFQDPVILNIIL